MIIPSVLSQSTAVILAKYYDNNFIVYSASSMRLMTTSAEISRLAASGMTSELADSITSSVTISPRRTGRQCMNLPLSVTAMCLSSIVYDMSFDNILP